MYCCCGGDEWPFCGGGAWLFFRWGAWSFLGGLDPGRIGMVVKKGLQYWGLEFQSFDGRLVEKGRSTGTRFSFEFQTHPPGGPSE
eukprot:5122362-Ditylum_brightwellii.AAC.1